MFFIRICIILTCLLFFTTTLSAQLNISITPTHPTCTSNGALSIEVTGGSGDYTFFLEGNCGEDFPVQEEGIFTTLLPCTYTITVTDDDDGTEISETVELEAVNEPLQAELGFVNCELAALAEGGAPPYNFTYSTVSEMGPFTDNGADSIIPVGQVLVWVRVSDDCGNSVLISGDPNLTAITDFNDIQLDEGLRIDPEGGSPPYLFSLTSSVGTFENSTGLFPWDQVGCNPRITITSICNGSTLNNRIVDINVRVGMSCVRFFDGYAELYPLFPGRAPFLYTAQTPSGEFTSSDGIFTDLPPNAAYYRFRVEDACGVQSRWVEITRYQLEFQDSPANCENDSLLLEIERQCNGPFFDPVEVTCLSCPDQQVVSVDNSFQDILFTGNTPGNWDILTVDNCGDQFRCQDTVILELLPACDSIVATVVDQFICDNGITNRRVIADTTAVFTLFDESGSVLEADNTSGVFENLPLGTYRVDAQTACGPLTAEVTLEPPTDIDPVTEFFVYYSDYGSEECQLVYDMRIEKLLGPFVITGGPDGTFYEVLNNYGQDNCRWYWVYGMLPGEYTITSMSRCGMTTITLPTVVFPTIDSVSVLSSCPDNRQIEVHGEFRSHYEWWSEFLDLGIRVENEHLEDRYYVNGQYYRSNIIDDLPAGEHTVFLVPRFASLSCAVDSFTVFIPEYEAVDLVISGDIICDGSATSDLRLRPSKGNGPYTVRQIDCNNPTQTLATYSLEIDSSLVITDAVAGVYCFVVEDNCNITSDFQVEVRPYTDEIEVAYTCDPILELRVDTLRANFTWRDQTGAIISESNEASIIPPDSDASYTVAVELASCTLERTVDIPYRPVLPEIFSSIAPGDTLTQCGEEALVLTAQSDPYSTLSWSTGLMADTLVTDQAGDYTLSAINDLNCMTALGFTIQQIPLPEPDIIGPPGLCEGDSSYLVLGEADSFASYTWSNGLTAQDSLLIETGGDYGVSVLNEYGCQGIDSLSLALWALPQPAFANDSLVCPGTSTALTLTEPYEAYQWNTDATTPEVTVGAGAYEVTVTDQNGCKNSEAFNVVEYPQLVAAIAGDTSFCTGDTITIDYSLTNSDGLSTFELLFSDNSTLQFDSMPGDASVVVAPPAGASSIILNSVSVADYNCPIELEGGVQLTQFALPEPMITGAPGVCAGDTIPLELEMSYEEINWSTGATEVGINVDTAGVFQVSVTDFNGCQNTTAHEVVYWQLPEFSIVGEALICPDQTSSLQANSLFAGYSWSTGTTDQSVTVAAGEYALTVTDGNGCQNDDEFTVTERPQAYAGLAGDTTICYQDTAYLQLVITGVDTLATGQLIDPAGTTIAAFSSSQSGTVLPVSPGLSGAVAIAEIELAGYPCPVIIDTDAEVTLNQLEVATTVDPPTCSGYSDGSLALDASSDFPPFVYQWESGATAANLPEIGSGEYEVTVLDQLGCSWTSLINVPEVEPLSWELIAEPPVCFQDENGSIGLNSVSGGTGPYSTWFQGSAQNGEFPLMFSGLAADYYTLELEDINGCMIDTVVYLPEPLELQMYLGKDEELVLGESLRLEPELNFSDFALFEWSGTDSVTQLADLVWETVPFASGRIALTVYDSSGCSVSDALNVIVDRKVPVYAPNAFSPNTDGNNDSFTLFANPSQVPAIESLQVFDRWGGQLFSKEGLVPGDPRDGWDGTANGELLPVGIYVWQAKVRLVDGTSIMMAGDVTLVR